MSRLVLAVVASLAVGGCAALAGAGLGGAGGFLVAGPPGAVVGAGAGAVGGAVGSAMRRWYVLGLVWRSPRVWVRRWMASLCTSVPLLLNLAEEKRGFR